MVQYHHQAASSHSGTCPGQVERKLDVYKRQQADIPADQAPALKAAVAAIAGMDEDGQAVQVWVRCNWVFQAPTGDAAEVGGVFVTGSQDTDQVEGPVFFIPAKEVGEVEQSV